MLSSISRNLLYRLQYTLQGVQKKLLQSCERVPMGRAAYKSAKERGGRSFDCFPFNHTMSCLQRLDALEANNWTNNNIEQNHQQLQSPDGIQHSERHHITISMV